MVQPKPVHENREHMMFWLALRIARVARKNNTMADIAYRHLCECLREMLGEKWFRKTTPARRRREILGWFSRELGSIVNGMPHN